MEPAQTIRFAQQRFDLVPRRYGLDNLVEIWWNGEPYVTSPTLDAAYRCILRLQRWEAEDNA